MRLIDADEAKRKIKKMQTLKASERMLFRLALDRTPTYEPPNLPLTLEELREMDGDPIYIPKVGWKICYGIDDSSDISYLKIGRTTRFYLDNYGEKWSAYRRKMEVNNELA